MRSDNVPLLRLQGSGCFNPGPLRSFGEAGEEQVGHRVGHSVRIFRASREWKVGKGAQLVLFAPPPLL